MIDRRMSAGIEGAHQRDAYKMAARDNLRNASTVAKETYPTKQSRGGGPRERRRGVSCRRRLDLLELRGRSSAVDLACF